MTSAGERFAGALIRARRQLAPESLLLGHDVGGHRRGLFRYTIGCGKANKGVRIARCSPRSKGRQRAPDCRHGCASTIYGIAA